jgi:hypothetical protein
MSGINNEILQIQAEIDREKLRAKAAIKNGAIFEEVKKIVLGIKELEKKPDACLANQYEMPGHNSK